MERYFKCYDIKWDTDGEVIDDLEDCIEVCVPEGIEDDELDDFLGDAITDHSGFCHFGFDYHEVV